ncbi:bifunctional indole-3-glycerol-phosphate synthase TrpC/phosphoribosylanthranilate isomerase TrpF [Sphingosinicella sp. LHD-64]|uniref:bifunctional indole-3-glycerol-phosphate synthase TrpC/phosphoribosylanthranilate isomerase TrpF n=1 Tax=Sphingosinicella sp. LHD-64 TaxID=3072139 RepID=UPI00280EFAA7|nr:bifunctional indole-3-glycerol-phosphate synthase TrpC/phosphoribosylanthranilate isomerase TrpF [Sphingosinicella sp. LHD-64]MDQ8755713.1 bifunctional indole-3-glycerol-phosphate synthase TrpC/phosphoribosylanthranilate isomerase TrpF [Sphingosinicella sp. LHD-64]
MREPGGVLGEILALKRRDVAARLGAALIGDLRGRAEPTRRSLKQVLGQKGARFVMEVKKASPSGGAIRPDADPAGIACAYAGAASAISVLTDAPFFGGSLDDLRAVRRVFDGPILAKDFVIDPRQVVEARLAGADAVLVMLSVLDDAEAAEVLREAEVLGMDALVEAHDETELRRAVALGAPVIGINNRDLRTLEVDLATTERLAHLVPGDRVLVAESGIADRADVERLAPFADAFLVGSSLMRAPSPAQAARALAFGRVKVCGLRDTASVEAAAKAGASYAGAILVPGTPRAVTTAEAEPAVAAAKARGLETVGVFRNEKLMQVARTARVLELDTVQLHGEEDGDYIAGLKNSLPEGVEVWAAGAVGRDVPAPRMNADRTIFDTQVAGRSGGTGVAFDWARVHGREDLESGLLAGGLNPDNAAAASKVGAWALDVSSGVESAPGVKDAGKLAAFFGALRPAVRGEIAPC